MMSRKTLILIFQFIITFTLLISYVVTCCMGKHIPFLEGLLGAAITSFLYHVNPNGKKNNNA